MELHDYFEKARGTGILATADSSGQVNAAIYGRPHVLEDGTVAMITRDRLTRQNLLVNPHAAYLFIEEGPGYRGKRLYLTKIREEEESDLLYELKRRPSRDKDEEEGPLYLIMFRLDRERPLVE